MIKKSEEDQEKISPKKIPLSLPKINIMPFLKMKQEKQYHL